MIVTSQASVSERESAATPITAEETPAAFDAGSVRQQARGGGWRSWDANHDGKKSY